MNISTDLLKLDDEKCNVYKFELSDGKNKEKYLMSKTRLIVQGVQADKIALYNRVCGALPFFIASGYKVEDIPTIIKYFDYRAGEPNSGTIYDAFQSQIHRSNLKYFKKKK